MHNGRNTPISNGKIFDSGSLIVQADYLFSEIKSRGGEPFALNVQIVLDCIGEMHHFWTFNFKQINPKA
jgi:hypothetical protein